MKPERPLLLVLGSGFAAFTLIKNLDLKHYRVTIVSPRNHFLFTPLLPSTTVGTVEFRSIIEPIRTARKGMRFHQAQCVRIDYEKQIAYCEGIYRQTPFEVHYDKVVIAVGGVNNTFGIPGVEKYSYFLKELADAYRIRHEIIQLMERASKPDRPKKDLERLLHFVVVGGGPTGVEFAAELHDFAKEDLSVWYPEVKDYIRITLLEAMDEILSTFDKKLSDYATKHFQRANIDVRTKAMVSEVRRRVVVLNDGEEIPYGLLVWSTGIGPRGVVKKSGFKLDRRNRIEVDETFAAVGCENVYAVGDCASIYDHDLPMTAQVAQQEGKHLVRVLEALAQEKPPPPFEYKHMGMMAYVGDNKALADLPKFKGRGVTTWFLWRSAYLTKLVSFRNKILVMIDWIKTFFFGRDISQIEPPRGSQTSQ